MSQRSRQQQKAKRAARGIGVGSQSRKRLFALEYVKDYNGKQAAIRAGYSPKSAHQLAYQMLHQDPKVIEWVIELQKLEIGTDEVLKNRTKAELAKMGFVNLHDALDDDNRIDFSKMTDDERRDFMRGVSGLKTRTTTRRQKDGEEIETVDLEIKLDKKGALDSLAKINGQFIERIGNPDGSPIGPPPDLMVETVGASK